VASLNHSPNIEWINPDPARRFTLNPLGAWCKNGCAYCYRERMTHRLKCPDCQANRPHEHLDRLVALEHASKGAGVFLCSLADPWSPRVERWWRQEIIKKAMLSGPGVTCFILTKRPDQIEMEDFKITMPGLSHPMKATPPNLWLGTSVACQDDLWRAAALIAHWPGHKFLSVEPILGPIDLPDAYFRWADDHEWGISQLNAIRWLIIGGLSGSWLPAGCESKSELTRKQVDWTLALTDQVEGVAPIFVKTKPARLPLPDNQQIQQWPEGMFCETRRPCSI